MLFLGHIATGLALADATDSDRAAAIAGTMLPDVIDKTAVVLRICPSSRWLAHGLPFCGFVCLGAFRLLDRKRLQGFALGYLGHLVCDLWCGGKVPWLAPFGNPRRWQRDHGWSKRRNKRKTMVLLLPELVGAVAIYLLAGRNRSESGR